MFARPLAPPSAVAVVSAICHSNVFDITETISDRCHSRLARRLGGTTASGGQLRRRISRLEVIITHRWCCRTAEISRSGRDHGIQGIYNAEDVDRTQSELNGSFDTLVAFWAVSILCGRIDTAGVRQLMCCASD